MVRGLFVWLEMWSRCSEWMELVLAQTVDELLLGLMKQRAVT